MTKSKKLPPAVTAWFGKAWVQWCAVILIFFLASWFFMGNSINHCSTSTASLGSDSTGGLAWMQWAGGNDLSWGHTDKSNYPFGESLEKPQFITSTLLIVIYKIMATLTTPICGINLLVLLGYMSTGLLMYGLVKWLINRIDIALFAGFAAAFVPYHLLKAESHINYIYGSIFIALIWSYLWFLSRPSYRRAIILGLVGSIGYYFDGYFILISSVLIGALFASSFLIDGVRLIADSKNRGRIFKDALSRLKYILVASLTIIVMLIPIAAVYKSSGNAISQSLASVRSNIQSETMLYGIRPIEFILPSYDNIITPSNYQGWRATKLHGSNYSESTLYMGYSIIVLALTGLIFNFSRKQRNEKLNNTAYYSLSSTLAIVFIGCFALSLPAIVTILGHQIETPTFILAKLTASWRVLSRFFLAMDPIVIIMASLGLYALTKNRSKKVQLVVVLGFSLVLLLEYMPANLRPSSDINKDAPSIYKQLRTDRKARVVAEYPLADFSYTPGIFTFQSLHNKTLVNSGDGSISRGPFDSSIAGLNDPQTIGALKQIGTDVIVTHGFRSNNPNLTPYRPSPFVSQRTPSPSSYFSYKIKPTAESNNNILIISKGYESLSVDENQISHRAIPLNATMQLFNIKKGAKIENYTANFKVNSICPANAQVTVEQAGRVLWSGSAGKTPVAISVNVRNADFNVKTTYCAIDITNMSARL